MNSPLGVCRVLHLVDSSDFVFFCVEDDFPSYKVVVEVGQVRFLLTRMDSHFSCSYTIFNTFSYFLIFIIISST